MVNKKQNNVERENLTFSENLMKGGNE